MMHLGIILDEERLQHEHGMLHAVCNRLAGDEHTYACFVPEDDERDEKRHRRFPTDHALGDLGPNVHEYPMHKTRRRRHAAMAELARAFDRTPVDVFYAVGHDTWPVAMELAALCECPLMLDVWSAELVRRVPRGRTPESLAAFVAPTPAIAEALRRRVDPALVSVVPFGVLVPERSRVVLPEDEEMSSLAILGNCTDMKAYRVMLAAVSELINTFDSLQVFLELRGPHQHDVWRLAQRLDLLDRVSCLNDGAMFRPLLTQCDVIAVPERLGRVRSLVYEAMAAGIPAVFGDDPWFDDQEASLGEPPTIRCENRTESWIDGLSSLFDSPVRARRLGNAGRDWIAREHSIPRHAAELLATATGAINGGVYSFPTST